MKHLGLTITDKSCNQCTQDASVSIPLDKMRQVNDTVCQWLTKVTCTKRQKQSILGLLLYVHKCVKPACAFLNRVLLLLRSGHASQKISLTPEFSGGLPNIFL